jgi:hypothetical protein
MERNNEPGMLAGIVPPQQGDWSPSTFKQLDVWVQQNLPELAAYLHLPQY